MSELRELYQQLIIDHGRHPRHFGTLAHFTHSHEGYNPLCGDRLTLYIIEADGMITHASFEGSGCAISTASTSLMLEAIIGKSLLQIEQLFDQFHALVVEQQSAIDTELLGKLMVLAGVSEFPARIKCATLCWHTLQAALKNQSTAVSTE